MNSLVDIVRNSPWYLFYPTMLMMSAIFFGVVWAALAPFKRAARSGRARAVAELIADRRWYVRRVEAFEEGGLLELHSDDVVRTPFVLPIRPGHPDFAQFMRLERLEIVAFYFQPEPLDCALESEFCAFLRLKNVSHVW